MGLLNDEAEDAPAEVVDQAAFAPLAAGALKPSEMPVRRAANNAAPSLKTKPVEDLKVVRPPSILNLLIALIFLALLGVGVFVAWANAWSPVIWEAPLEALSVAFRLKPPPPPPALEEEEIIEDVVVGRLEIQGVGLRFVELGHKRYAVVIDGMIANVSNRVQKAIFLEVSVARTPGGLPHRSRTLGCCEAFTPDEAEAIAKNPEHPHFDKRLKTSELKLQPMDSRSFTVIIPDIDKGLKAGGLFPAVRIKGSESERAQ